MEQLVCDSGTGTFEVVFSLSSGSGAYQWRACGESDWQDVTTDDVMTTLGSFAVGPLGDNSTYCVEIRDLAADGSVFIYDNDGDPVSCVKTAIDLTIFEGEALEEGNKLTWITGSEERTDYFTLQYSKDGELFNNIAVLKGRELSNTSSTYEYLHEEALVGVSYYRLLETDMDGQTAVASRVLALDRKGGIDINIVPVPSSDFISLSVSNTSQSQQVLIQIYDIVGKLVTQRTLDISEDLNNVSVDVREFATGTYLLSITDGDQTFSKRFVKE